MSHNSKVPLSLIVVLLVASAAQPAPPLPQIAVETFPPAARAAVADAHRAAVARDRDGAAAGALGRVLQAWEQWDSAHQAYRRAQALEPRALSGIISTRSCCSGSRVTVKRSTG